MSTAIAVLLTYSATAELQVLYDSGQSWPIDPYLEPLLAGIEDSKAQQTEPAEPGLGAADLNELLPIRSPGLTPGPVATREFDAPIPVAFFMVGSDQASLRWLKIHRDYLRAQGAVGLLVDASDEDDLHAVAAVAGGLAITPASGDDIATALAIKHYPLAVTEGRLWQ